MYVYFFLIVEEIWSEIDRNDCNKKLKNMIRNMKIFRIKLLLIMALNRIFRLIILFFFFFIKKSVKFLGYVYHADQFQISIFNWEYMMLQMILYNIDDCLIWNFIIRKNLLPIPFFFSQINSIWNEFMEYFWEENSKGKKFPRYKYFNYIPTINHHIVRISCLIVFSNWNRNK